MNEGEIVAGSPEELSANVISDARSSESHDSEMNPEDIMKEFLNFSSDSEDGLTSD